MQYEKINLGSYRLHLVKTTSFKSLLVKVCFHNHVQKEKVTERNFLVNLLLYSTHKKKTKKELSIFCQDLYAAQISGTNRRIGNFLDTSFTLSVLEDTYTEEGNFKKCLYLLHDILLDPNVENESFREKDCQIIRAQLEANLHSNIENLARYSIVRALENTDSSSPISIRGDGYLEDLDKITPRTLYEHYKEMIEKDAIDIFVIGNIDFKQITEDIKEIFHFKTFKKEKGCALLENPKVPKKVRNIIETAPLEQTKLVIICRLCNLTDEERNYPLTLYNIILGGGGDSKLFKEVREKDSLCYDIRSVPNKADNCLLIIAGVARDGKEKALQEIKKQFKQMEKGAFQEEDILKAKEFYLSTFDVIEDSMTKLAESYYMMELLGVDDLETKKKKMLKVDKEEIMAVAKKVKIDLIYTLEGGNHEKANS